MYRVKNNRILPYLNCTVVNKNSEKFPVKSITVGPGNNQNLVFNSVINIVEGNNCNFFDDNEFHEIVKDTENTYSSEEELREKIKPGQFACYNNSQNEKVVVYNTIHNILIFRSPIPFRD